MGYLVSRVLMEVYQTTVRRKKWFIDRGPKKLANPDQDPPVSTNPVAARVKDILDPGAL